MVGASKFGLFTIFQKKLFGELVVAMLKDVLFVFRPLWASKVDILIVHFELLIVFLSIQLGKSALDCNLNFWSPGTYYTLLYAMRTILDNRY